MIEDWELSTIVDEAEERGYKRAVDYFVQELREAREEYQGDSQHDVAYGLKLAIEIIKAGGKNDD